MTIVLACKRAYLIVDLRSRQGHISRSGRGPYHTRDWVESESATKCKADNITEPIRIGVVR